MTVDFLIVVDSNRQLPSIRSQNNGIKLRSFSKVAR